MTNRDALRAAICCVCMDGKLDDDLMIDVVQVLCRILDREEGEHVSRSSDD